jgi:hypothetical protein
LAGALANKATCSALMREAMNSGTSSCLSVAKRSGIRRDSNGKRSIIAKTVGLVMYNMCDRADVGGKVVGV